MNLERECQENTPGFPTHSIRVDIVQRRVLRVLLHPLLGDSPLHPLWVGLLLRLFPWVLLSLPGDQLQANVNTQLNGASRFLWLVCAGCGPSENHIVKENAWSTTACPQTAELEAFDFHK